LQLLGGRRESSPNLLQGSVAKGRACGRVSLSAAKENA
jgi:hypothetical protein